MRPGYDQVFREQGAQVHGRPKIEFANSLRGVAAMSVVVSHYLGVFWVARQVAGNLANTAVLSESQLPTPALAHAIMAVPISWGPLGVALFFLISGFVIPFAFSGKSAGSFLVGRFFRIYPLYIAGFSVTLFVVWVSGSLSGREFPYGLSHVLIHYIPGLRDLFWKPPIDWIVWTLEIELKFYLVCAVAAALLRRGSILVFLIPVALLGVTLAWTDDPSGSLRKTLAFSAQYMIYMFVGVAFNFWFRRHIRTLTLGLICGSLLAMTGCAMTAGGELAMTLASYAEAFVIFAVSAATAERWREVHLLTFFADISYPLYVVHGVLGYALIAHLTNTGVPAMVAIAIALASAIAIAWVLHVLVEMPTHRIGQRVCAHFSKDGGGAVLNTLASGSGAESAYSKRVE